MCWAMGSLFVLLMPFPSPSVGQTTAPLLIMLMPLGLWLRKSTVRVCSSSRLLVLLGQGIGVVLVVALLILAQPLSR